MRNVGTHRERFKHSNLVPPHGGKLLALLARGSQREEGIKEVAALANVRLNSREVSDLIMLATGAFSPLQGFVGKEDYESVVEGMRLKNGLLWPIPITLSASNEEADKIKEGQSKPFFKRIPSTTLS